MYIMFNVALTNKTILSFLQLNQPHHQFTPNKNNLIHEYKVVSSKTESHLQSPI